MNANVINSFSVLPLGKSALLPEGQRVDNRNWTRPPFNRWSFQRVQQFTRTLRVARAKNTSELSQAAKNLEGVSFIDSAGERCSLSQLLQRTWTDGFLVMHRGRILHESYYNGMGEDSLHLIMSCSKSFTSTLAGVLMEQGNIATQDRVDEILPELQQTGFAGATLQQLLDMQVGVLFNEDYSDLNADWRDCEMATGWREPEKGYSGPTDMLSYAQTRRSNGHAHGERFEYQSVITNVIGCVLERVTERRFDDLFAELIWHPLDAEQDLVSIVDAGGYAAFEGGFNICLRDFARFGQMMANGGCYNGSQIVPKNWIDQCRFPDVHLIEAFTKSQYGPVLPGGAYHNQWWVRDPHPGTFMALGVHGQTLYIDPNNELVIAKMSCQPEMADTRMVMDQLRAFDAITAAL
jgi:CubicO group peptidase (beta-lactamase class C family)